MCGAKLPHHQKNVLMERPQQCGSRPAKTGPVPVRVKTVSMENQPKAGFPLTRFSMGAVNAHHSLTQPCGPKPRQWKPSLTRFWSTCNDWCAANRPNGKATFETFILITSRAAQPRQWKASLCQCMCVLLPECAFYQAVCGQTLLYFLVQ